MAAVDLRASRTGYLTLDQAAAINASDAALAKFSAGLPKAELHLHIEGTIEPEMVLTIARRNGIAQEGADDAERFCAAQRAKRSLRQAATSIRATTRPRASAASPRTSASSSRAIRSRRPSPHPKKRQRSWKGSAPTARASPRDRLDILLCT